MSEERKGIGLVGCGAIGTEIAKAIAGGEVGRPLAGIRDIDTEAAARLAAQLDPRPEIIEPAAMAASCEMIVECAAVGAVDPLVGLCIDNGVDLMVMSIGGLTAEHFDRFRRSGSELYVPSGAVCGLDGIQAYADYGIESLTLTTRKPPAGLSGVPYLEERGIDVSSLDEPLVVFEGSPAEAIKHFPKNINVSTALGLASSLNGALKVRLMADPGVNVNIHEVDMVSSLGKITIRVENRASASNPKTSALAYLSAIATLKKIFSKVKIGT